MKKIFSTVEEAYEFVKLLRQDANYQIIQYGNMVVLRIW